MGISERKAREKEQMKSAILTAAMNLFVNEGIEKVSIRKIAAEIEYSPATIYLYFKDKDEILYELHRIGFTSFRAELSRGAFIKEPFERLRFIGRNYIDFAMRNTAQYDLMFIMRSPIDHVESMNSETWEAGKGGFFALVETVTACLHEGLLRPGDPHGIAYSLWSYVHGLCSLAIRNRMSVLGGENDWEIAIGNYDYFIDGLKA